MDSNVVVALLIIALVVFGGSPVAGEYVVPVSEADVTLLARLIDVEAGGEPYRGKVAVGAVVVNRMQDPRFPDRLRDVIYEPGQFDTAGLSRRPVPSSEARQAAEEALRGSDPTGGALYFYNPDLAPTTRWWASRPNKIRIGNHVFTK